MVRVGYKQTEVGEIPEGWDEVYIKDISTIRVAKDADEDHISDEPDQNYCYPVFSNTVDQPGIYGYYDYPEYSGNAVTVVGRGVGIGTAICRNGGFGAIGRLIILFPKRNPAFLANYINYKIDVFHESSGVPQLTGIALGNYRIAYPSDYEQKLIAKALSDVDELIASLENLITKKRDIRTATMQQLLTGKKRLPGFGEGKGYKQTEFGEIPEDWDVVELGNYAKFFKGKGLAKSEIREDGKKKCIHYGELFTQYPEVIATVRSKTNSTFDSFYSIENDVLMPTSDVTPNGLAVASCILEKGVVLGGDVLIIRLDSEWINGGYLSYKIRSSKNQIMQLVTGSTVYHLYGSDMARFTLVIPQNVSEQKKIVDTLTDMSAEIDSLGVELEKIKDIKQGMMQELLTGHTRLIDVGEISKEATRSYGT